MIKLELVLGMEEGGEGRGEGGGRMADSKREEEKEGGGGRGGEVAVCKGRGW